MALSLLCTAVTAPAAPLTITIASDSTAAVFPPDDYGARIGWGQVLSEFFDTNVVVNNLAASGRSSKSFYEEGRWTNCLRTHADFYLIQFGHNDDKPKDPNRYTDPQTAYKSYLSNYVNQARASNGIPVLLTPPTRRKYQSEHTLKRDRLQEYAQAMREVGGAMNVAVLDVLPASIEFYEFVGQTQAPLYQARTNYDDVFNEDATHFNRVGAFQHDYLIMHCLLNDTNTGLAPLRAALRTGGVKLRDEPAVR